MVRFRDAVRQGRVVIRMKLDKRTKEKIIDQATRLPYHFSDTGALRYVIETKENMRKEGIKSPDMIDCMSFAFLENCSYMASDTAAKTGDTQASKLMHVADSLFSDIEGL